MALYIFFCIAVSRTSAIASALGHSNRAKRGVLKGRGYCLRIEVYASPSLAKSGCSCNCIKVDWKLVHFIYLERVSCLPSKLIIMQS